MAMPEYTPAPAPSKAEFDSLASDVSTLNVKIANIVKSSTFSATLNARGAFNIPTTNLPLNSYPLGGYTENGYIVSISKSNNSQQWDGYLFAVNNSNQVITPSSITESVTVYYLENPS